jgi:hypothetical protein
LKPCFLYDCRIWVVRSLLQTVSCAINDHIDDQPVVVQLQRTRSPYFLSFADSTRPIRLMFLTCILIRSSPDHVLRLRLSWVCWCLRQVISWIRARGPPRANWAYPGLHSASRPILVCGAHDEAVHHDNRLTCRFERIGCLICEFSRRRHFRGGLVLPEIRT